MRPAAYAQHRKAVQFLLLATIAWGLSFPIMKAAGLLMAEAVPAANSWFHASLLIAVRFCCSALILLAWSWRSISGLTRSEIYQGVGLGIFGGLGILFQMDGLAYTHASTSAFLTQGYVLIIPWIVAVRDRQLPRANVLISAGLMMIGAAILTGLNLSEFKLGRGEIETMIAAVIFTGQILWLERPMFAGNNTQRFSIVMFVVMTLVAAPIVVSTMTGPADIWLALNSRYMVVFVGILVLVCTLVAYIVMNHWQRFVPATEAGIIYGAEPIFASLFALFLPAALSSMAGLAYASEKVTWNLAVGGGLILAAIVLIQFDWPRSKARKRALDPT